MFKISAEWKSEAYTNQVRLHGLFLAYVGRLGYVFV
jgi:predicted tellurium resistance membrane protein TerC